MITQHAEQKIGVHKRLTQQPKKKTPTSLTAKHQILTNLIDVVCFCQKILAKQEVDQLVANWLERT